MVALVLGPIARKGSSGLVEYCRLHIRMLLVANFSAGDDARSDGGGRDGQGQHDLKDENRH